MEVIDLVKKPTANILQLTANQLHETQEQLCEMQGDLKDLGLNNLSDLAYVLNCLVNDEKLRLIKMTTAQGEK